MKIISLAEIPEEGVSHNPEIKKKVMLRKGEVPCLHGFAQARFAPGQSAGAHAHQDMYEIFLVESGRGVIRIGGKGYNIEKGVCVAVEPGEVHDIINPEGSELVLTYFGLEAKAGKYKEALWKRPF